MNIRKHKNQREARLKNQYGISLDRYNRMFRDQNGNCAICEINQTNLKSRLCVDHDHILGHVRGLICDSCNVGISRFRDNPKILQNAIEYLLRPPADSAGIY